MRLRERERAKDKRKIKLSFVQCLLGSKSKTNIFPLKILFSFYEK